jgi:hypothetical protein
MKRKSFNKKALLEKLDICTCEHSSQHHKPDELGNLLDCDIPNCDCDHFRSNANAIQAAA